MSQTKLYVGNLSYHTTEGELRETFSTYGEITELKLITDRDTGRSKGFAFVSFETAEAAESALSLNDTELDGRKMRINFAKDDGGRRGGGGNRFGGNGGQRQRRNNFHDNY
jgi:heterogeneous nuclear ribonucleoprotein A1/A3